MHRRRANTVQGGTMPQNAEKFESKSFNSPEEVRKFDKGKVELVNIAGATIGRATFEPGWKWSTSVKPIAERTSCQAAHFGYQLSGTMTTRMDYDGTERTSKAGDVLNIPPGHDAWVVGNEPVVVIDFQGMVDYAKQGKSKVAGSD
jgi:quercetin dioxygenase-like cupin family protein